MRHVLPCLILVCPCCFAHAQSTNYSDRINHIFGAIDKTRLTTSYLKEFIIRFNKVDVLMEYSVSVGLMLPNGSHIISRRFCSGIHASTVLFDA